ncbi:MAG TPA: hypothetical protein PLO44_01120 [Candidatus Paceibacterota bacterium]|nr:hypothetical protein [Candidatus Paceibacterota bacterium]
MESNNSRQANSFWNEFKTKLRKKLNEVKTTDGRFRSGQKIVRVTSDYDLAEFWLRPKTFVIYNNDGIKVLGLVVGAGCFESTNSQELFFLFDGFDGLMCIPGARKDFFENQMTLI